MANELETMVKNQMQLNLVNALDSAVQAGDIKAAREATKQLQDFAVKNTKQSDVPQFTNADIRAAIKANAAWFGVDPRRSAKAVEYGKNMEPQSFKSAEEFALELIKAVENEFDPPEDPEDDDELEEKETEKSARKKTDSPSGHMARAIPRRSNGPWSKLSDAPKDIAQQIKASADKFTRTATKEQREKYIATALGAAYAADQRGKAKK